MPAFLRRILARDGSFATDQQASCCPALPLRLVVPSMCAPAGMTELRRRMAASSVPTAATSCEWFAFTRACW